MLVEGIAQDFLLYVGYKLVQSLVMACCVGLGGLVEHVHCVRYIFVTVTVTCNNFACVTVHFT